MILFYKSIEAADQTSTRWYFSYYDKNLQQVWVKSAPILSPLEFKASCLTSDTLNLCFEADKKNRNRDVNFQILRVLINRGGFILNNGKTPGLSTISFFQVIGQKGYMGLNDEEKNAQILLLDLPTGQADLIPLGTKGQSVLSYLTVDPVDMTISALVTKTLSKHASELYLTKQKPDGGFLSETLISNYNSNCTFNLAKTIKVSPDETLITGTYNQGTQSKKGSVNETTGFFASPVISTIQTSMNRYNFLDLKNIRQLLSERDILNLRKKSIKKNRSEQEYSLDFSLFLHEIIVWDEQYILVAETYYPQYHTESFTDYDFYGRPFTNTYTVFDGYRFSGVLVASFDKQGKLLWDNAMDIRNILTYSLEPKVSVDRVGDEMVLSYLTEGKIASAIMKGPELIEKTSFSELELMTVNDKRLAETNSQMVPWYDEYFLCYGYQEIRDITKGINDKKWIFFCNKVRFDR